MKHKTTVILATLLLALSVSTARAAVKQKCMWYTKDLNNMTFKQLAIREQKLVALSTKTAIVFTNNWEKIFPNTWDQAVKMRIEVKEFNADKKSFLDGVKKEGLLYFVDTAKKERGFLFKTKNFKRICAIHFVKPLRTTINKGDSTALRGQQKHFENRMKYVSILASRMYIVELAMQMRLSRMFPNDTYFSDKVEDLQGEIKLFKDDVRSIENERAW